MRHVPSRSVSLAILSVAIAVAGCCPADALRSHLREIASQTESVRVAQARCREDPVGNAAVCDQVATSLDNIQTAAAEAAEQ